MAITSPAMQVLLIVLGMCIFAQGMKFAVLSDLHIGESSAADASTREAIDTVNSVVSVFNLSFVIITGDITSSALPAQYELARKMLDTLTIPYYPIFGNHDVWVYVRPTNETSWQEKVPTGDALFAQYFEDIFIRDNITYNFNTVWNPEQKINSTFLNWEMRVPSPAGTFVLFGLDFVTREGATNPKDLYKGGAPTASLHDFPNGTLDWFEQRLNNLPSDTVSVVTAHHHTVVTTPFFTPDYFSMNEEDRRDFRQVLTGNGRPASLFWGALVGHMHFWDDQTALFGTYRQWETTAAKQDGSNSIAIAHVDNGTILSIERCCGVSEAVESMQLAQKTLLSAFFFLVSVWIFRVSYSLPSLCVLILRILSFIALALSQVVPLIGGNAFVTKHINANYMGPIVIVLFVFFGIKNFSRDAIFGNILLVIGTTLMGYPIRTSWVKDGENFNVFWVYITAIIVLLFQAYRSHNQSRYKWALPLILSFILGILMELLGATISSILYRMLSPITLSFYETLEHVTIASLIVIFVVQFIVIGAITKSHNVLYCIPIAAVMQTMCNALSQLVLRTNSYPIPYVYLIVSLSVVPLAVGIITLTNEQRKSMQKETETEKEREHEKVHSHGYIKLNEMI